ncbi:hypothetical protein JHK85_006944 [Glycine max]|uniref:RNase H type-1 domain-containing protein n=2 Tax=Glycine subgen. Soja TaxID=1462606 RepID=A0A0R0KS39_SOYBN|nr:hypothetical protein JHK87_006597 [Glycine soja]KAG5054434.1 hypothetical protein JHK85_006944 [Glycine max]KAG5071538.1 hypothetical protein JHK86_006749 [Glycine max]RZC19646.1 hypothetical protein D0Y65_006463 [Glycine soja]
MQKYYHLTMHLLNCFDEYELKHIFRENNDRANILSKLVSSKKPRQHRTFIQETFTTPSIDRNHPFMIDNCLLKAINDINFLGYQNILIINGRD